MKKTMIFFFILMSTVCFSQSKVACEESDQSDAGYTKTCTYKIIKVVSSCQNEDQFRSCKNEYYLMKNDKYVLSKLSNLFNYRKDDLLLALNQLIEKNFEENKKASEDCFEGVTPLYKYTFEDMQLTISEKGFEFTVHFGLEDYCKAYDDVSILYTQEEIEPYLIDEENDLQDYETFDYFIDKRDGKTYTYAQFGNQYWMTENLAYKVRGTDAFAYNDDPEYVSVYGYLYYFTNIEDICPAGWHFPEQSEWEELIKHFDKEAFHPQLGGIKYEDTGFAHLNEKGYWWTNTYSEDDEAYRIYVYDGERFSESADYYNAISVRCVKD